MSAEARTGPRRRGLWLGLLLVAVLLVVAVRWTRDGEGREPPAEIVRSPAPATTAELPALPEAPILPIEASSSKSPKLDLPEALGALDGEPRSFTVRVVDELGRAVPGAQVRVWTEASGHPEYLPPPGTRDALITRQAGRGGDPGGHLSWRGLTWTDPTWGLPTVTAETDESGRAHLTVRPGVIAIEASSVGVGTSLCWTGAAGSDLALELHPIGTMTGVVLAASGQLVADATVYTWPAPMPRSGLRARRLLPVRTDAQGRFQLEVNTSAILMAWALASGDWSAGQYGTAGGSPGRSHLELRFYGRFAIEGRTLRPDGSSARDVLVSASGPKQEFAQATTGGEGRFRLEVANPGHWSLVARTDDLISQHAATVMLEDGAPTADLLLPLVPSSSISGRVAWGSGDPAAGFSIEISPKFQHGENFADWYAFNYLHESSAQSPVESDASGNFVVGGLCPSLTYMLTAEGTEDGLESSPVTAPSGAQSVELTVYAELAGLADLDGRVVDAETGKPIPVFELRLARMPYFNELLLDTSTTVEDADGRFVLRDLSRNLHWIQVRAEGYPPKTEGPVTPGEPVEVRLDHLRNLLVTVVDETDAAVPGAIVRLRRNQRSDPLAAYQPPDERTAMPDGRLVWIDLLPEDYALQAMDGQAFSKTVRVDVGSENPCEVTLRLDRSRGTGQIVIRTRHADGRPYAGVALMGGGEDGMPFTATSDERGEATLGPLPSGSYTLLAPGHRGFTLSTARVEAGETTTIVMDATD